MAYTIGCRWLDYGKEPFTAEFDTAEKALAEAEKFQMSDVRIEYIDTPEHGRLDTHGFRTLYGKR